jgi:folate-dependent phosphoribosylglycinamide formyltransferase PurN
VHHALCDGQCLLQSACLNAVSCCVPHRYRGAAPVQRALCDGVTETGVSIAYTVFECDAGPVLVQQPVQVCVYVCECVQAGVCACVLFV